jgi:hypothetical protein
MRKFYSEIYLSEASSYPKTSFLVGNGVKSIVERTNHFKVVTEGRPVLVNKDYVSVAVPEGGNGD